MERQQSGSEKKTQATMETLIPFPLSVLDLTKKVFPQQWQSWRLALFTAFIEVM